MRRRAWAVRAWPPGQEAWRDPRLHAIATAALDRAVWSAYDWDDPDPAAVAEDVILARLLTMNHERTSAPSGPGASRLPE